MLYHAHTGTTGSDMHGVVGVSCRKCGKQTSKRLCRACELDEQYDDSFDNPIGDLDDVGGDDDE